MEDKTDGRKGLFSGGNLISLDFSSKWVDQVGDLDHRLDHIR